MPTDNHFRENLFGAEPINPDRQQRFRQELAEIVEPRLPSSHRLYYKLCLAGIVIGLPGAACGLILDVEHRWIWALTLIALLPMAGWMLHILRQGAEPARTMQSMSKALVGITMAIATMLIVLALQNPTLEGVLWAFLGLLMFLLTNFINLWNRTIESERTMREQVLSVEYRLADLAERVAVGVRG